MAASDRLNTNTPSGKLELSVLQATKVGDVRPGLLYPAIPSQVEWVCREAWPQRWQFEGRFCGLPFVTVEIALRGSSLELTVKEKAA